MLKNQVSKFGKLISLNRCKTLPRSSEGPLAIFLLSQKFSQSRGYCGDMRFIQI